ncbi:MAG: putative phage abortive infection protein, partial [Comamonas sp.]
SHSDRMFYANILKAIINQDAFEAVAMYAATHNPDSPYYAFKQLIQKYELLEELDLRALKQQRFVPEYAQVFSQLKPLAPL